MGGQRGLSLVELMVAMAIMAVSMLGFVGAMRGTMNSTAVAHRRTEEALLRTGLIERLAVTRRSAIDAFAGQGWMIESCYDENASLLGSNAAFDPAFACAAGAVYVRHLEATAVPDAAGGDQRVWTVAIYVDRTDLSCTPSNRHASTHCVAADLYLND